jgi:cysteine-rich repeat protein
MRGNGIVALLGGALLIVGAATNARASLLEAKCESGKYKCMAKLAPGLMGCYSKDSGKPLAVPDALTPCLVKVKGGFDTALTGCIAKLDAKNATTPCVTLNDAPDLESQADTFTQQMAAAVDTQNSQCTAAGTPYACCTGSGSGTCSSPPAQVLSKCNASKKKCISGKLKGLLGCYSKNAGKPEPDLSHPLLDACLAKVQAKFDGGATPEKGCLRKVQDKLPNDCSTGSAGSDAETDTLEAAIDTWVDNIHPTLSCGNGRVEIGESCDDDGFVNGDGCDDHCRPEVCGDGIVSSLESCDDGNTVNADSCPSDCTVDACTPNSGSHQQATVSFATSGGATVAGISVLVDYPEGKVSIPGSGPAAAPRISGLPSGTSGVTNDYDHLLREVVQHNTPFSTFPAGQLFKIDFETCSGAPALTTGDFTGKCTVAAASNGSGFDVTANVTCSVTVP